MNDANLRQQVVSTAGQMASLGLNRGTSGNVGARSTDGLLVTPSGVPAEHITLDGIVSLSMAGEVIGKGRPTSEWRIHRDILQARPEVHAVVHAHSPFATTLACLGMDIPPFHYMIAVAGGDTIRCTQYALFGTQALSNHALTALADRKACLLGNHGMIAIGRDLDEALSIAVEVESLCEQYWRALQIGQPRCLSPDEMHAVLDRFKGYGRWGQTNDPALTPNDHLTP
ncbi:class II aldolase/adducin family protein [Chitinivorax sp. B]|uniref:class II aldolase/adducin family protein n=1 Tax=Chitinivorax sp. B TaxID=2502235 RepID=UPI0010F8EC7E|nr:class II aldolase/adducin family protein [Chitinivorax sp. B]